MICTGSGSENARGSKIYSLTCTGAQDCFSLSAFVVCLLAFVNFSTPYLERISFSLLLPPEKNYVLHMGDYFILLFSFRASLFLPLVDLFTSFLNHSKEGDFIGGGGSGCKFINLGPRAFFLEKSSKII